MQHAIEHRPSYSLLNLSMDAGDRVLSDSGAMAWMAGPLEVKTSTRGGVLQGLKRKLLAGESFFQNEYVAAGDGCELALAPGSAGDLVEYPMTGQELFLERGAFLASTGSVVCDSKWDGLKGLFNQGLFILRCSGTGTLFFHAYGDIQSVDVDGEYVIDNGYAVAWEPSLQYSLTRARKIRSFLFGDQLLLRFSGRGRVWVQSRSPQSLANFVHPFRRVQRKNNG
ncbi:MAG: TIGR00266 family protein [Planctomycetes bacterium]|nr:TIGR00266 family protein [Planctomycetota bacterium]MBV21790.1 TIGR00266 family protein [Planctomycetaceae bacterium]HJM56944.1 TIGR00266 family protein [Planctomycetota bacterium]